MIPQEAQIRTSVFLGMTAIIASEPMRRLMNSGGARRQILGFGSDYR